MVEIILLIWNLCATTSCTIVVVYFGMCEREEWCLL